MTGELLTLTGRGEPAVDRRRHRRRPGAPCRIRRGAYVADSPDYADYVAAPKAELSACVADKAPAAVLVAATSEGREVAARLAVKTGSGILTDITLAEGLVAEQSIFGGHYRPVPGARGHVVRGPAERSGPEPSGQRR